MSSAYRGCLEVSQDVTEIRKLEGEKNCWIISELSHVDNSFPSCFSTKGVVIALFLFEHAIEGVQYSF